MAIFRPAPLFETIQGALTKINKKSQHADDERMVLATHRTAETTSKHCSRLYLRTLKNITRTTPVLADELKRRSRFAAVSAAVAERAQDLSRVANDTAAFKAQKDQPNGKKTMKAYLWSLELATYDAQHA